MKTNGFLAVCGEDLRPELTTNSPRQKDLGSVSLHLLFAKHQSLSSNLHCKLESMKLIFDILPAELEKNPAGHAMQEDAPIITTASKKYPVRRIQGCSYPCAHYKMERYLSCVFLCVYLKVKKVKQNDELCTYLALSQSLDPW